MPKPPILAATADAAEPLVRQAAEWLAAQFTLATVREFYACSPCEHTIQNMDRTEQWTEGYWGVAIVTPASVSLSRLLDLQAAICSDRDEKIELVDVDISTADARHQIELTFTLTARLADPEPDDDAIPGYCMDCGHMAEILEDDDGTEYYACGRCGAEWPLEDDNV